MSGAHNPKSILTGRNNPLEKLSDHHATHVTFAKLATQKLNVLNKPDPIISASSKISASSSKDTSASSSSVLPMYANAKKLPENEDKSSLLRKAFVERDKPILNLFPGDKTKNQSKPTGITIDASDATNTEKSNSANPAGKKTPTSRKKTKPKKHAKSVSKLSKSTTRSLKSVAGSTKGSKTQKKLKKSKKSATANKADPIAERFKPAKLNAEYTSELNKITEILKAVSKFDEGTTIGSGAFSVDGKRVKVTSAMAKEGDVNLSGSVQRPLSADELKQLLTSITRVVSLHQLPVHNQPNGNIVYSTPPTTADVLNQALLAPVAKKPSDETKKTSEIPSTEVAKESTEHTVKKKRKIRKVKKEGSITKTKSKASQKSKSKSQLLKPLLKPKDKNPNRPYSEGGSTSSIEKDPVQNAAFLRKYFEESTKLANQVSDEETDGTDESQSKKLKKKKSLLKKGSKKSVTNKKGSSRSLKSNADSTKLNDEIDSKTPHQIEQLVPAIRNLLDAHYPVKPDPEIEALKNGKKEIPSKNSKNSSANASIMAVAGSSKSISSVKSGISQNKRKSRPLAADGGLNSFQRSKSLGYRGNVTRKSSGPKKQASKSEFVESLVKRIGTESNNTTQFRPTPEVIAKIPLHDAMKNSMWPLPNLAPLKQINGEIDHKFTGDTKKMKSIWDKTPYQPTTHTKFKDFVIRYATAERTDTDRSPKPKSPLGAMQELKPGTQIHENASNIQHTSEPEDQESPSISKNMPQIKAPMIAATGPDMGLKFYKPQKPPGHLAAALPEPQLAKPEPTITEIQPPPKTWNQSEATSTYNRINYDYNNPLELIETRRNQLTHQRKINPEAEKIRKKIMADRAERRAAEHNQDLFNATVDKNFDIFKFYKDAMKKNGKHTTY